MDAEKGSLDLDLDNQIYVGFTNTERDRERAQEGGRRAPKIGFGLVSVIGEDEVIGGASSHRRGGLHLGLWEWNSGYSPEMVYGDWRRERKQKNTVFGEDVHTNIITNSASEYNTFN
ncbi:hypothetical protein L6452_09707 [Arctium lappa]|uniref:Uncharacterized protein n=1 Tax=Arctium lappa TaxID=4217 RepID=A0ACB9DKS6_ARCLA|nr:hypothetical protein L6452_09707 [Arctium lappa]